MPPDAGPRPYFLHPYFSDFFLAIGPVAIELFCLEGTLHLLTLATRPNPPWPATFFERGFFLSARALTLVFSSFPDKP